MFFLLMMIYKIEPEGQRAEARARKSLTFNLNLEIIIYINIILFIYEIFLEIYFACICYRQAQKGQSYKMFFVSLSSFFIDKYRINFSRK